MRNMGESKIGIHDELGRLPRDVCIFPFLRQKHFPATKIVLAGEYSGLLERGRVKNNSGVSLYKSEIQFFETGQPGTNLFLVL